MPLVRTLVCTGSLMAAILLSACGGAVHQEPLTTAEQTVRLEELKKAFQAGSITESQYDAERDRILGRK